EGQGEGFWRDGGGVLTWLLEATAGRRCNVFASHGRPATSFVRKLRLLLFFALLLFGLAIVAELLAEPFDLAGRVHELHLAREERVRRAGDVQLDQRILVPVGPLDCVVGLVC